MDNPDKVSKADKDVGSELILKPPVLKVPPLPFSTTGPVDKGPVNVAVPEVFVMDTVPAVVKPAMLCDTIVPEIVIGEAFALNIPPFTKLPPSVNP